MEVHKDALKFITPKKREMFTVKDCFDLMETDKFKNMTASKFYDLLRSKTNKRMIAC